MSDPRSEWTVEQWREKYADRDAVRINNRERELIGFYEDPAGGIRVAFLFGSSSIDVPALDIVEPWTGGEVRTLRGDVITFAPSKERPGTVAVWGNLGNARHLDLADARQLLEQAQLAVEYLQAQEQTDGHA